MRVWEGGIMMRFSIIRLRHDEHYFSSLTHKCLLLGDESFHTYTCYSCAVLLPLTLELTSAKNGVCGPREEIYLAVVRLI